MKQMTALAQHDVVIVSIANAQYIHCLQEMQRLSTATTHKINMYLIYYPSPTNYGEAIAVLQINKPYHSQTR